jgi:hypothetical protein
LGWRSLQFYLPAWYLLTYPAQWQEARPA